MWRRGGRRTQRAATPMGALGGWHIHAVGSHSNVGGGGRGRGKGGWRGGRGDTVRVEQLKLCAHTAMPPSAALAVIRGGGGHCSVPRSARAPHPPAGMGRHRPYVAPPKLYAKRGAEPPLVGLWTELGGGRGSARSASIKTNPFVSEHRQRWTGGDRGGGVARSRPHIHRTDPLKDGSPREGGRGLE